MLTNAAHGSAGRGSVVSRMEIDSYSTPGAKRLLQSARARYQRGSDERRVLLTEAAGATAFLVAAGATALLAPAWSAPAPGRLAPAMLAYLIASRVKFPVGSAWTRPTQLVFVPMLFMLPPAVVPLVVASCLVLDTWSRAVTRDLTPGFVLARVGDAFYSLGPVWVLLAFGVHHFSYARWPVLLLAFGAQVVCDLASGLGRTWFAERILPTEQIEMVWIYVTDACLSCGGLLVADTASRRPATVLLALPLMALLGLFAHERQQRLEGTLELSTAYRGTALLLGDVVEGDDKYTGVHSRDVVDLSVSVADALGLDASRRMDVEFGALLHDVGKIRVPKEILNKPGNLDDAEREIMRRHTIEGEAMLKQVGGVLARVGTIVRASHERWDGRGYPDGLAGEAIPVEARIITACDSFSAMTTDRSYRHAIPVEDALAELARCSGSQFDPAVVAALVALLSAQRRTDQRRGGGSGTPIAPGTEAAPARIPQATT
jgi:HD-GYP domain-containing protein (c-di-GMP phosphodiesterase class II)